MATIALFLSALASAQITSTVHPSGTSEACYTDHDDIHFNTVGGDCNADFSFGFVEANGATCDVDDGAVLTNPGGDYCLVEDTQGNLWSIQKDISSSAGLSACSSATQFSTSAGCVAAPKAVPVSSPWMILSMIMGLLLIVRRYRN